MSEVKIVYFFGPSFITLYPKPPCSLDFPRELTILDILSSTVSPSTLNEKDPPIISEPRTGEFPK